MGVRGARRPSSSRLAERRRSRGSSARSGASTDLTSEADERGRGDREARGVLRSMTPPWMLGLGGLEETE
jgi:hypothetical protein